MAVYCAMIDRVDQNLGRVFAKVEELGEWDNTLIMFLSDNGGCAEQPNTTPNVPPGPVEGYRTVSVGWANASNTPYRKFKSTDYEGGACTPFIAYWPGKTAAGTWTNHVGHLVDFTPTLLELAGVEVPGRPAGPIAGAGARGRGGRAPVAGLLAVRRVRRDARSRLEDRPSRQQGLMGALRPVAGPDRDERPRVEGPAACRANGHALGRLVEGQGRRGVAGPHGCAGGLNARDPVPPSPEAPAANPVKPPHRAPPPPSPYNLLSNRLH